MNHFLWDNKCDQNGEKRYHSDPGSRKHIFLCVYHFRCSNRCRFLLKHRIILAGTEYLWVTQRQALPQKACNHSILNPFNRWLNKGGDLLRNKYFFFSVPEGDLRENTVYFESNSLADGDGNIETLIAVQWVQRASEEQCQIIWYPGNMLRRLTER